MATPPKRPKDDGDDEQIPQNDIGGDSDGKSAQKSSNDFNHKHTRTFKRSFKMYIDNAMDRKGLKLESGNYIIDDGWQYIPYKNLSASIPPREWAAMSLTNRSFHIESMGFNITAYRPMMEEITAMQGITDIRNEFVNNPECYFLKDDDFLGQYTIDTLKATQDFYSPNNGLKLYHANNQSGGKLIRAKFNLGNQFTESVKNTEKVDQTSITTWDGWNMDAIMPGSGYSHTWTNPSNHEYNIGRIPGHANMVNERRFTRNAMGEPGTVEMNQLTQNNSIVMPPPSVMCCMLPIHGKTGPINLSAQIDIEFFSTLTFRSAGTRSIFTNNWGVLPAQSANLSAWSNPFLTTWNWSNPAGRHVFDTAFVATGNIQRS